MLTTSWVPSAWKLTFAPGTSHTIFTPTTCYGVSAGKNPRRSGTSHDSCRSEEFALVTTAPPTNEHWYVTSNSSPSAAQDTPFQLMCSYKVCSFHEVVTCMCHLFARTVSLAVTQEDCKQPSVATGQKMVSTPLAITLGDILSS